MHILHIEIEELRKGFPCPQLSFLKESEFVGTKLHASPHFRHPLYFREGFGIGDLFLHTLL